MKLYWKLDINILFQVCVFHADRKNEIRPWPLIGWNIFDFSSETALRNFTKLNRKQGLNVLYQVCVFQTDQINKMAAVANRSKSGTLLSGTRYVALWASSYENVFIIYELEDRLYCFSKLPIDKYLYLGQAMYNSLLLFRLTVFVQK